MIKSKSWRPIVFLDEPSLSHLDPLLIQGHKHFLLDILKLFTQELSREGALCGLHCCGKTDWSLVFDSGFDIVSFDAVNDMGHFLEKKDLVRKHFENGKMIAWGLVPSEYLGYELDCHTLVESFIGELKKITSPALSLNHILMHSIVTSACGTGTLSVDDSRNVHQWVHRVSQILRKEILNVE